MKEAHLPRLVWITAPAGFGKTSLVLDWIDYEPEDLAGIAWYSLEADDNDLNRFISHLTAAIQEVDTDVGMGASLIARSALPVDYDATFTALINEIARRELSFVLVFDDVHAIESQAVISRIEWLIHHFPDGVCVIATSRYAAPFDITKLRLAGDFVEVSAADLVLSDQEAAEYLESVGPTGGSRLAARINESTGGWFAALTLAAQSVLARKSDTFAPGDTDALVSEQIYDYYAAEIISGLDDAARQLLVACSILNTFTAEFAEHVSEESRSGEILRKIATDNVLVSSIDRSGTWYRFHPLMRDFLNRQVMDSERLAELHLNASEWLVANGYPEEAFDHTLLAGQVNAAVDMIGTSALEMFFTGRGSGIIRLTDRLPYDLVAADPRICVARAYVHVMNFEFEDARRYLSYAEKASHPEPRLGDATADHSPLNELHVAGQIAVAESSIATFERNLDSCIRHAQKAVDLLGPEDQQLLEIAHVSMATAFWGQGDLGPALESFRRVSRGRENPNFSLLKYMATANAGHVLVELGRFDEAADTLQSALAEWKDSAGKELPFAAMAYSGLAEVCLQRGDVVLAGIHSQRALELADTWGAVEVMLSARVVAARVAMDEGDRGASDRLIADAKDIALSHQNEWWSRRIDSQVARFAARRGDPVDFAWSTQDPEINYENLFDCLTQAEVMIAERSFSPAGSLIDRIETFAIEGGHRLAAENAAALRLYSVVKLGAPADATLRETVNSLVVNRAWRCVLKLGAEFDETFLNNSQLLGSLGASELVSIASKTREEDSVATELGLSARELEVLNMICMGLSNDEIGDRLVLAKSTIKTHINRLYRKIGVSTRPQAVVWAVRVGLIAE